MADARGSIIGVMDSAGNVTDKNTYDAYGNPASTNVGRFQYTGQMWLAEAGVYHYKARAYDPTIGRFLQTDPIGYGDSMNMYAYAGNDPVNGSDPTGLAASDDSIIVNCEDTCRFPSGHGSFGFAGGFGGGGMAGSGTGEVADVITVTGHRFHSKVSSKPLSISDVIVVSAERPSRSSNKSRTRERNQCVRSLATAAGACTVAGAAVYACVQTTAGTTCGYVVPIAGGAVCYAATQRALSYCSGGGGHGAIIVYNANSAQSARAWCREQCTRIFVENPDALPGYGKNYQPRLERCINECVRDVENGDIERPEDDK